MNGPCRNDEAQLSVTVSFDDLLATLPRLILRSRTPFAAFLASTFHTCISDLGPATAVFPLPLPHPGIFQKQRTPKLSHARWRKLKFQRALHILVVALNYVDNGMRPLPAKMLGRRPSLAQLQVFKRLRALLTACDQPGAEYALPPGRSGFEFVARLVELEHFANSSSAFSFDYGQHEDDEKSRSLQKIEEHHKFEVKETYSPIDPYRDLQASRLKLSGKGQWDMQEFLTGVLWLPFQDPSILLHGDDSKLDGPSFKRESIDENTRLALIWDCHGLLDLHPCGREDGLACRVFNAHKSTLVDRQIGDRRWLNSAEAHPRGPSAFLPAGSLITNVHCGRGETLYGCASDRKDFYHQAKVSRERSFSNLLPFEFPCSTFIGTSAWTKMLATLNPGKGREQEGDRLGMMPKTRLRADQLSTVHAGFASLYQGDHLGVEFALESHTELLQRGGLLVPEQTILNHHIFPAGPCWQGLVIDDFFAVSREKDGSDPLASKAVELLKIAEDVYGDAKVVGSDEKTIRGADVFKIVGAEVTSDRRTRSAGLISVVAPLSKRIPMIALTLRVAELPVISKGLASKLGGNWISILMFRRCLTCLLSEIFGYGNKTNQEADEVVRLTRSTADELVVTSIFGLLAATDVSVPYDSSVFATDASNHKGAVTELKVPAEVSEILWLGSDKRGGYTMLDGFARAARRGLGVDCDEEPLPADLLTSPAKTIDFAFDFVEICGGSGVLSQEVAALGYRVCTPIDLSRSPHHDMKNLKLINWIYQMLAEGRFLAVACEPPCTTFSSAQYPPSRSYSQPLGFNRSDPKTFLGNLLCFRCFSILWFAWRYSRPSLLETPHLSKMAWLSFWTFLKSLGFEEAVLNSCAFGSIHKKAFRLLSWGLQTSLLSVPCPGNHRHVKIEGKYTKVSAIYHPGVAKRLAHVFGLALRDHEALSLDSEKPKFESIILNDLLSQDGWSTLTSWEWKKQGHINVLESRAFVALEKKLLDRGGDRRFVALLDSRVAKGAHSKGRSSARALRPSLLRSCSYLVAGNLHPGLGFAPTRLNTADAPSRDKELPLPAHHSILDFLSSSEIAHLHSHQFSKASASWIRLYLLAVIFLCPVQACSPELFPLCTFQWNPAAFQPSATLALIALTIFSIGLGFFGATLLPTFLTAPSLASALSYLNNPQSSASLAQIHFVALLFFSLPCEAMPMQPLNRDEELRATRRSGTVLQADRVVLQSARNRRDQLLGKFDVWLAETFSTTLEHLLEPAQIDPDFIAETLVAYGKDLYSTGKSYGIFSETINAVAGKRPALRRQLTSCWDLAFNWVVDEPHEHHCALPQAIMLAMVGLALLWGWSQEAAIIAMSWVGVLRIGEVLSARREDLILPSDAVPGVWFALLKIKLPKTRGRAARHQSSRIDPEDVVRLLEAVYSRSSPSERLWYGSPSLLRKRFSALQSALGLARGDRRDVYPYSLSSLRPGGATYWLQLTEDAEFVRRKGRWLSTRVLEIYLQEASFMTFTQKMTQESLSRVSTLCSRFPEILEKAIFFRTTRIPECAWPRLW